MDLEDQAIDGGGELTVRQIGQKAETIGLSLIALALQLNQLLTFFFDQDPRGGTPLGSRGVTADLPLSKRYLRLQASDLSLDPLHISEQSLPVVKQGQHLAL